MIAKKAGLGAVGRRKNAVARVYLRPGTGAIVVNGKPSTEYFSRAVLHTIICQPFVVTNAGEQFDVMVNVNGGGISGQAGAVRHAIARALMKADEAHKLELRKHGYLTRDPREVERKKYGRHGARRRPQYSKR